jgi:hypothetical protein
LNISSRTRNKNNELFSSLIIIDSRNSH